MVRPEEIDLFNLKIHDYFDKVLPINDLVHHGIQIKEQMNKSALKVRAFHFSILSVYRHVIDSPMMVGCNGSWEYAKNDDFYFEKELKEFALQCLYLLNIPLGECVVQRTEMKKLSIVYAIPIKLHQLSCFEQENLTLKINKKVDFPITYGADLEVMLYNSMTKKYVSADILSQEGKIGYDAAIVIHDNQILHPIIEVRPSPAVTMKQLHTNLLVLYDTLRKKANYFQLEVNTKPHPFGRFFLGGHLHFGNIELAFPLVRLLDRFVAIPFAYVEEDISILRRRSYGRLGSIRENQFNGFEYRVLPTWFGFIPDLLPMLEWIKYILTHTRFFTAQPLAMKEVESYYQGDRSDIDLWGQRQKPLIHSEEAWQLFQNYLSCLKNLY